jgi:hypothetical protein
MSSAQSNISTLQGKVSTLESKMSTAESDISAAKSDISALETQVASIMGVVEPVVKEDEEIVPSVLTHVDLENEALKIYKVCVGRVPVFKNVDYSVSVVEGKSRLTWINDMAVGGSHAVALSDKIYCTYLHSGASEGEGGGGSGGGGSTPSITWNSSSNYDFASDGSITSLVEENDFVQESTSQVGPVEFTFVFNGFLTNGSRVGIVNDSGVEFMIYHNGTSTPNISAAGGFSSVGGYGLPQLSSGQNTFKIKIDTDGAIYLKINDAPYSSYITIASLLVQYRSKIKLQGTGTELISASKQAVV